MKQKILLFAAAIALMAVTSYGTTAYFTAQETAYNVITVGNIAMKLHDNTLEDSEAGEQTEAPFPENGFSGVTPGRSVDKLVYLENTGSVDFYCRIQLEKRIVTPEGAEDEMEFNEEHIRLDIDEANWTYKDGYYYYNTPLAPGKQTTKLFTKVTFAPEMGNEYSGVRVEIDVSAQAVQSRNNGETVMDAQGWPAESEEEGGEGQ